MSASSLPWWVWIVIAVAFYFLQLGARVSTDKGGTGAWVYRIALITVMLITFLLGIVRFVKWAWQG